MLFDNSTHTLDLFCLMQFIKDNGVFVKSLIENALRKNAKTWSIFLALSGMKDYEDRNHSKAGC